MIKNWRSLSLSIFLLTCCSIAFSQDKAPVLRWQRALGGDKRDAILPAVGVEISKPYKVMRRDSDGGYIIAGSTGSNNNGDVGPINGDMSGSQIWVVKLDSAFNIKWNKLYGGVGNDIVHAIETLPDGGYILVANSDSYNIPGNHGFNDILVVKLDKNGNIIWGKNYGGSGQDVAADIIVLNDGFVISGATNSKNGDVTGHHNTDPNGFDVWVIRLDFDGNFIWKKCYGTSVAHETEGNIKQTADGGFIIAANASRDGEDVSGHHGNNGQADIWLLKLTGGGDIQWQKCVGGTGYDAAPDIELTTDGGYILAGSSNSWNGDAFGNHLGPSDGWIVKLNASGQVQWQNCFGGSGGDGFNEVILTPDGGYVAAGWTNSKDGDITEWFGGVDYSMAKFNNSGSLIWQRSFGGQGGHGGYSYIYSIINTIDNEFIILGNTDATTGQITGNHGDNDLWLIRAGTSNVIKGNIFIDKNANGIRDVGEVNYNKLIVSSQNNSILSSNISDDGAFFIPVDTGTYITTAVPYSPYFNVVPLNKASIFSTYFNTDSFDFALQPIQVSRDLAISLFALTPARPGFSVIYQIFYENSGTESLSGGTIKMIKPANLNYGESSPAEASINADTISWNFGNLDPGQTGAINVRLVVQAAFGSLVTTSAHIIAADPVMNPFDDTAVLKQVVTGSYDPNDKQESNGGTINQKYINDGKSLQYLIRFQNTGNDTAFNVVVRDTLGAKLDWSSLQMIGSSHRYRLKITDGNKLAWEFRNILLPDSNINEPASHGYIAYRIKPKNTVVTGDVILNSAGIYFDYNLPVQTNTEQTVVMATSLPVKLSQFEGVLRNDIIKLNWKTATEQNTKLFEIERSTDGANFGKIGEVKASSIMNGTSYSFIDELPVSGFNYYRLKIVDEDKKYSYSTIVVISVRKSEGITWNVYPNPSPNGVVSVNIFGKLDGICNLTVVDVNGRLMTAKNMGTIRAESFSTTLNLGGLQKGTYVIKLMVGEKLFSHKVQVR